jgi:DNA-binding transcriptional MerR regulator
VAQRPVRIGQLDFVVRGTRLARRKRQRDSSGYGRDSAQDAIELIKTKTLADAGMPLARIGEMLAADADQFAAAVVEIDRNLRERAEEIVRTRERVA